MGKVTKKRVKMTTLIKKARNRLLLKVPPATNSRGKVQDAYRFVCNLLKNIDIIQRNLYAYCNAEVPQGSYAKVSDGYWAFRTALQSVAKHLCSRAVLNSSFKDLFDADAEKPPVDKRTLKCMLKNLKDTEDYLEDVCNKL